MTSSARDKRYGRRGGRWVEGTAAEAIAELEKYRADKAARDAADATRVRSEQPSLFEPGA